MLFAIILRATVLVIAGYFVWFASSKAEDRLKNVGKYLAMWTFAFAVLYVLGSIAAIGMGMHGRGGMGHRGGMHHGMHHGGMGGGMRGGMGGGMRGGMMHPGMGGGFGGFMQRFHRPAAGTAPAATPGATGSTTPSTTAPATTTTPAPK